MKQDANFTDGSIFLPLIRFSLPVLLALLLQAMYGAVDLWVVGRFAEAADVSGVATGSQIMHTLTGIVTGTARKSSRWSRSRAEMKSCWKTKVSGVHTCRCTKRITA